MEANEKEMKRKRIDNHLLMNALKSELEDAAGNVSPEDQSLINEIDLDEKFNRINLEDQPEFIQKMNWDLLRKQKCSLLKVIYDEKKGKGNDAEDLIGILHLLDAIQDYAVDGIGFDEIKIFGETRG